MLKPKNSLESICYTNLLHKNGLELSIMKRSRRSPAYKIQNSYGHCFRMIVSRDLQKFVENTEIRYSLKTGYLSEAKSKFR